MIMSEKIHRSELLKILREGTETDSTPDELDKKALEGYRYLEEDNSAKEALGKLDDRFDHWLESRKVSQSATVKRMQFRSLIWRVAAAVLVLLIPAYFVLKPTDTTKLVAGYLDVPRSTYLMTTRGDARMYEDVSMRQAFTLYEKKAYGPAARALRRVAQKHPDKPDIRLYQGISLLADGKGKEAVEVLDELKDISVQNLDQRAPWYLALAHLRVGNTEQAAQWLEKTIEVDANHATKAAELLEQL